MLNDNKILVGVGDNPVYLLPKMANRHGLIAGATGTGKTSTLKVLAEGFSAMGVPVFLADIKGDVSSLSLAGTMNDRIKAQLEAMGMNESNYQPASFPCRFWDVFGKGGIPVRATVTELGPTLLARLLNLTEVQAGVLNIAFHVADDNGLKILDYKDLRAVLTFIADHRTEITTTYGNITTQSIGAIQRALLALSDQGAESFFGEPALDINDWIQTDSDGRGIINVLHCVELAHQPLLYATYMLWMLSELYEGLPEVGDLEKPKMVFFFDEAHMLFNDAPKAMLDKIIQVIKLIRSKGVGIYFITQSPADIPDAVLAQLNNRIQHALRAYTPAEQKAVRIAAQSFRANPNFKTEDAISNIGTGVALVSLLDEKGVPCIVEQATICPPQSGFVNLSDAARAMLVANDPFYEKYKDMIDNESAYEILEEVRRVQEEELLEYQAQLQAEAEEKEAQKAAEAEAKAAAKAEKEAQRAAAAEARAAQKAERDAQKALLAQYKAEGKDKYGRTKLQQSVEKAAKNTAKSVGRDAAKKFTRGILGTNTNKTLSKAAQNMVGSMASDFIGSFFR